MPPKPGIKTSEFWVTTIVNLALAIVMILSSKDILSSREAELWVNLVEALAVGLVPLAMALVTASYADARARVKSGQAK